MNVTVTEYDVEHTAVPYIGGRVLVTGTDDDGQRVTIHVREQLVPGSVAVRAAQVVRAWDEVPDTE